MNPLVSLVCVFAFWAAGEAISRGLRLPIPGSVIGLLLLYTALRLRLVPEKTVAPASRGILRFLGLLFVPAGVGVIAYPSSLWPKLLVVIAILTPLAIGAIGVCVDRLAARIDRNAGSIT